MWYLDWKDSLTDDVLTEIVAARLTGKPIRCTHWHFNMLNGTRKGTDNRCVRTMSSNTGRPVCPWHHITGPQCYYCLAIASARCSCCGKNICPDHQSHKQRE